MQLFLQCLGNLATFLMRRPISVFLPRATRNRADQHAHPQDFPTAHRLFRLVDRLEYHLACVNDMEIADDGTRSR